MGAAPESRLFRTTFGRKLRADWRNLFARTLMENTAMKSVYIEAHGGTEVLTYGDQPDPVTDHGDVKIRVKATALNRLDLYTRDGGRGLEPVSYTHLTLPTTPYV